MVLEKRKHPKALFIPSIGDELHWQLRQYAAFHKVPMRSVVVQAIKDKISFRAEGEVVKAPKEEEE